MIMRTTLTGAVPLPSQDTRMPLHSSGIFHCHIFSLGESTEKYCADYRASCREPKPSSELYLHFSNQLCRCPFDNLRLQATRSNTRTSSPNQLPVVCHTCFVLWSLWILPQTATHMRTNYQRRSDWSQATGDLVRDDSLCRQLLANCWVFSELAATVSARCMWILPQFQQPAVQVSMR